MSGESTASDRQHGATTAARPRSEQVTIEAARSVYAIRRARTLEDVAELRNAWIGLRTDIPTSDPDVFLETLAANPAFHPFVVLLERGGEPIAAIVAVVGPEGFAYKLGYKVVHTPRVRTISVVYGGILGHPTDEALDILLHELRRALGAGDADAIRFTRLDTRSRVFQRLGSSRSRLREIRRPVARWELDLPASYEDFVRSRSKATRGSIRNYASRFEREFEGRFALKKLRSPDDLDELVSALTFIGERSWQGDVGVGFRGTEQQIQGFRSDLERGAFRAYVLEIDGKPAAYWYGAATGPRFHIGTTGYDPAYSEHRVGTYVLMCAIGDLCEDPAVTTLDYGLGDADYKRRYGSRRWEERDVLVFTRRPRALVVWLAVNVLERTMAVIDTVIRRESVKRPLKRLWRAWAHRRSHIEHEASGVAAHPGD